MLVQVQEMECLLQKAGEEVLPGVSIMRIGLNLVFLVISKGRKCANRKLPFCLHAYYLFVYMHKYFKKTSLWLFIVGHFVP